MDRRPLAAVSRCSRVAAVPQAPVTLSNRGPVAVVTVDDGATNLVNIEVIDSLLKALGAAQEDAGAVVLAGRAGYCLSDMDIEELRADRGAASDLLHGATELMLRLVEFPRPVVAACTGQALGAAAAFLLCCDVRVGAAGDYKIGLDWVARGFPVTGLVVELARSRLAARHAVLACNTARLYSPEEAVEAGFLDCLTTRDAVEEACEVAADLVERLDPGAFEATRTATCRGLADAIVRTAGDLWRIERGASQPAATP